MKLFMKNAWLFLACLLFATACSDDKVEEQTTITLPPETETLFANGVDFTTAAGSKSLEFTATEDWNITAAETRNGEKWYEIYPTSGGPGKAEVTLKVDENKSYDNRSVAITINAGKMKKTLMVSQKQVNALTVTSGRLEVKQEGGTLNVEVNANVEYKAVIADDCQDWIKATPTSTRGLSASTISFKVEMNGEKDKREGTIFITDGTLKEEIKVYQHGGDIVLLNENEYPVGDRGETIKVELRSNCEYGVKMPDVDWIKEAIMNRGVSSHTIYYTVSPNETNESRRAKIIFYDKENTDIADTLTVIQAQKDAVVIDNKNIVLNTPNDTIIGIDINANVGVEIRPADTCQWITESTASRGLQLKKIYLKAAKNESFSPRRGRVLIKSKNGKECDTLKIWQAGKPTTVKLEQTELNVPMEGGTYNIKVNGDVAVKLSKWKQLWPEGELKDEPLDDMFEVEYFKDALFKYENKPGIPFEAAMSADGQSIEIKVAPAVSAEATSVTITVYGEYENKEAQLIIRQEPDPTKIVRLSLTDIGIGIFGNLCTSSYRALQKMYSQEELYSRQAETVQGNYWYIDFINHTLRSDNYDIERSWAEPYCPIRSALQIKNIINRSKNTDLAPSDSTAVIALLEMQRFMLYYEMVNLWGKAGYMDELFGVNSTVPIISKAEVLKLFVEPLSLAIDYLPAKKITQEKIDDIFFPSRDFPALLLARICMEQGEYAKAESLLSEVVNSGRYRLGDLVYQLPAPDQNTKVDAEMVSKICFSYTEVLLTLAECDSRLGKSAQAEEYLNSVVSANIGSPAYSSNEYSVAGRSDNSFIDRLANAWQSQLRGTGTYFAFLKRNNLAESYLNIPSWRLVFPIPLSELYKDPNMSQNDGY